MKNVEVIIMVPLVILGLLSWMVIDLVRTMKGEPTVDDDWHKDYLDSNLNHGQGREDDEEG